MSEVQEPDTAQSSVHYGFVPVFATCCLWWGLVGVALISKEVHAGRPNVVLLLSDDLGWKDIGCYGGPVRTPPLDRLAREGTRFTDFYSGAAVCSSSRAVLLTGRTNLRCSIYSWINDQDQHCHLPTSEVTLAEVLRAQPTTHVHRFESRYRSPFDAFVYMNRIPIEPEALEDQRSLASRIESRLANQKGRVQIKLPRVMNREAYEGFKLAAGIDFDNTSCFTCHHLPAFGREHRDLSVPTLRNRTYTRKQLHNSLDSEAHNEISIDEPTADRLLAFLLTLSDVADADFRPLILNATVLDTYTVDEVFDLLAYLQFSGVGQ